MSKKTTYKDTSDKLFKLQDQLFELHGRVQELRHKQAMFGHLHFVPSLDALALCIQSAGEIGRLLDQVEQLDQAGTKGGAK
jgi:hypothetical protein